MAERGTFIGEVQAAWQKFWARSWKVKAPVLAVVALWLALGETMLRKLPEAATN